MNLPSPRIGPGSPSMDKPKVEQIVEMIEEKEKLNRSIDSEANSSLNRSMEAEVKREAVVTPTKEVVEVAAKVVDEVPIKEQDESSKTSTEADSPKEEISEEANIENWKDGKMEVVTINILVKLQPLVEVNRLVRRSVLLLPEEQDELEEARKTSKKIKLVSCSFLKRNHDLWKIKIRPYLTGKK